eukprot:GFYU01027503.1.p1 GENE.GFYU01027503.1~~GFYU01027503.1.p1  ORF type:complete len:220 (+),score=18.06 GFYU01027503.1:63-662(+)
MSSTKLSTMTSDSLLPGSPIATRSASSPSLSSMEELEEDTEMRWSYNHSHYVRYRVVYANILARWGLSCRRAEIMKLVPSEHQSKQIDTIQLDTFCASCRSASHFGVCSTHLSKHRNKMSSLQHKQASMKTFTCSLCRLPVMGLSSFCLECGHGGHLHHMNDWFETEQLCPMGCGCDCIAVHHTVTQPLGLPLDQKDSQ